MIKPLQILSGDFELGIHNNVIIDSHDKIHGPIKKLKLGWIVTETIGMAVINPRAIAKLTKKESDS